MSRTEGAHTYNGGKKSKKGVGVSIAVILAVLAIAAILFFWLFDVDAGVQGGDVDVDVPDVNADVDAPAVDADVDVNPEDEAEEAQT